MKSLIKIIIPFTFFFLSCSSDEVSEVNVPDENEEVEEVEEEEEEGIINVSLKATRVSGPAPLAVQFNTVSTSHSNSNLDTFRELGYHFTFDDPSSGTWKHSGKSKNSQIGGPIAAHVFESAGTYTVQVRAQDSEGNFSDQSIVITVTDPNEVYGGTDTVVISRNSDTSGAPSGAILLTNQTNWPQWESGKRYLLMPGQDFTSFGDIDINQVQDIQIGKNGSGIDPIVWQIDVERGSASVNNWAARIAISDLNSHEVNIPNSAEDIYIIRGTNTKFYVGSTVKHWTNNGSQEQRDNLIWPSNIFMYEATNTAPTSGFNSWILSTGFTMLGTELANPPQHNIRPAYLVNAFIAHNLFYNAARAKHNLKLHSEGILENENEPLVKNSQESASRWVVVADNVLGNGSAQSNGWAITVDPQNNTRGEGVQDVIVENNNFKSDFNVETVLGGRRLTERGNSSVGEYKTITSQNVSALPPSWDGPYYVDVEQIIPDQPGT